MHTNIIEVNTLEEFIEVLKDLDWYYHMSDDHCVYIKGKAQHKYYEALAQKNGPKWCDAWDNQAAKMFTKERGFSGGPILIRRTSIVKEWMDSPEYKAEMVRIVEKHKNEPDPEE